MSSSDTTTPYRVIYERLDNVKKVASKSLTKHKIIINDIKILKQKLKKYQDIRYLLPRENIDFDEILKSLGGDFVYVKSGSTGHTFRGIHTEPNTGKSISYALKLVAYPKKEYGDVYESSRPENAELVMISILSELILKSRTPHIVLPIYTFSTSLPSFVNTIKQNKKFKENKKYKDFIERYKKNSYYNNASILISEWATQGDLGDFLKKKYKKFSLVTWQVIFFQILATLAVIQSYYPGFRHNDLKANNILVCKNSISKNKDLNNFLYEINGQLFSVPNIGISIQLWDFDFACIPGLVENAKVSAEWTDRLNIKPEKHQYYDMHYFFNTLSRKGFLPEFFSDKDIHPKVKEFVKRVVPKKYSIPGKMVAERGRLLVDDEYMTPLQVIMNDEFFGNLRT